MENVYFNAFRDHMIGLPILGEMDTRDMVVDFQTTNYFGENIVIVGTGKIDH